ncbi:MFS transporter [Yersinia enterocolitica]
MTAKTHQLTVQPGVAQQVSTRLAFFISGLGMAAWAPLVPFAKERIGLNDASLGLLLLCIGVGSMLAMPLTGVLTAKWGCRAVILLAGAVLCLDLPLLVLMNTPVTMALALLVFGAAMGIIDVAMNIQAVIVEKASGRAMMSGFHGLFSVGWVMFIGFLCFVMFLAEGSMLDWSAVFLTTLRGMDPSQAGMGYAVFAIAMTLGRLNGDRIVNGLGRYKVLLGGSLCAAVGIIIAISIDSPIAALIGFMLVGLGASNVVPILFTAAGNQTVMPANLAVASITTIGYAGILAGPAAIGFVAQLSNLSVAFGCVAVLLLTVTASAKAVTR